MADFKREPGRPGKGEPAAPSRSVDVRVPLEILEKLEALARERGISRHQAIREAIAEWVERRDEKGDDVPLVSHKEIGPVE